MKSNPERCWVVELWGDGDRYRSSNFTGTVEAVLAHADEEECEVGWQVTRINIFSMTPAQCE